MSLGLYQDLVVVAHAHGGPQPFLEYVEASGFERGVAYSKGKLCSYAGGALVVGTVVGTVVTTSFAKLKERRRQKEKKRASIKIECGDLAENFHVEVSCSDSVSQNSPGSKEVAA